MSLPQNMGSERPASTVGEVIESNQVYSTSHPAYKLFSEAVSSQLAVLAEREAVRRSSAKPLVLPFSLATEELADLSMLYPEFAVVSVPLAVPVHSFWEALKLCANEWLASSVVRYGDHVVHYGGSLLSTVMSKRVGFHLETSYADDVSVHARYAERVAMARIFDDAVAVAKEYHLAVPRGEYDRHLAGDAYSICSQPASCTHRADSMCFDLSMVDISPVQAALAMAQHGAELSMGFFMFTPEMLVQDRGAFEDTNVWFERTEDAIHFSYPEGRVGVRSYCRRKWSRWLASHTFSIDAARKEWYQLELLKTRGPFMFFRMAKVPEPRQTVEVRHALELTNGVEYTLVKSWRLARGFASDVSKATSWVPNDFVIRSRVVRRVYEFAMQLTPLNFTRHAIKKQIRVVNDRWVVQGTTVTVAPSVQPQQLEDLTTAIFSKAFVDRYDSSQLSTEMMAALKGMVAFQSASVAERLAIVTRAFASWMYLSTFAHVDTAIRSAADIVVRFMKGDAALARKVSVEQAPTYVTLSSVVNRWSGVFAEYGESYYGMSDSAVGIDVNLDGPGGMIAKAIRQYVKTHRRHQSVVVALDGKEVNVDSVIRVVTDVQDTSLRADGDAISAFANEVARLNEVSTSNKPDAHLSFEVMERHGMEIVQRFRNGGCADPVASLNQLYADALPGMAKADIQYDTYSLSLDPQDRVLAAPYLRMSKYFGLPPAPRRYYVSKLRALSVPKRQNTAQELLSAIVARNLSAPSISVPQDINSEIRTVWDVFLSTACVDDAKQKLARYQSEPVALAEQDLKDWASQAKPEVVERLRKEMQEHSRALGDMSVSEYLAMIKSDVKPTMSDKPLREITAPQVIVYHDKLLSALYSSMFRVIVRRFLSLVKPQYHINLLKDVRDIEKFVSAAHPYGEPNLRYLENDFGKFDKSQSEFAFLLENYVFQQLGLNEAMLDAWLVGHTECTIRSVACGLSLHVLYQRKSGDATTAFGNVLLNVLSVTYAYRGTNVLWAVFMGDDSIVCASKVNSVDTAVAILAEVFNLTAKFYITDAPYFASNFFLIDEARAQIKLVPDPIKRIERLSMHLSADEPQWDERWVSFQDSMVAYQDPGISAQLSLRVPQRYAVAEGFVRDAADALGTLVSSKRQFRKMWEAEPELIQA